MALLVWNQANVQMLLVPTATVIRNGGGGGPDCWGDEWSGALKRPICRDVLAPNRTFVLFSSKIVSLFWSHFVPF
jgi:hypothetical protein